MEELYKNNIEPFLTNSVIETWIAPIITAIVTAIVIHIGSSFIRNKKKQKAINEANEKILNSIRPFIIQQIPITQEQIISIKNAVVLTTKLNPYELYTMDEIKDRLILDISETRFLKEIDKNKLFEVISDIFKEEQTIDEDENSEKNIADETNVEKNLNKMYDLLDFYTFMVVFELILFSIVAMFNISNEFLNNFLLTLFGCIVLFPIGIALGSFFRYCLKILDFLVEKIVMYINKDNNKKK